jgi:D-arabinose 1-dehydrogenase-like Zn-dependent alcohol dehydrogenase
LYVFVCQLVELVGEADAIERRLQHRICEMIAIQDLNAAFDRVLKGQVKYRFVIDMKSLKQASVIA